MQARLAETFQRSGSFGGVGKPGEGLAIDYQVIAEIRAFEVSVDGGERRRGRAVRARAQRPQRRVQASRTFDGSAPVGGQRQRRLCRARSTRAFGEAANVESSALDRDADHC